jgi:flagellar biosynthesis/type III secretory pathway protein FliH
MLNTKHTKDNIGKNMSERKTYREQWLRTHPQIRLYLNEEEYEILKQIADKNKISYKEIIMKAIQNIKEGYDKGYDKGFDEGQKTGYERGYKEGYKTGYDEGFKTGYNAGYNRRYVEGYNAGYERGQKEGYNKGQKEGHDRGYKEGHDKGRTEGYIEGFNAGYDDAIRDISEGNENAKKYLERHNLEFLACSVCGKPLPGYVVEKDVELSKEIKKLVKSEGWKHATCTTY